MLLPVVRLREIARRRPVRRLVFTSTILCVLWLAVSSVVAYKLTHRLGARARRSRRARRGGAWKGTASRPATARRSARGSSMAAPMRRASWCCTGIRDSGGTASAGREILAAQGYAVLMLTLRAHGDSTGDFDDVGFGARNDVIAGVDFLERAGRAGRDR